MRCVASKIIATLAVSAAVGFAATPASAVGLPLEPAAPHPVPVSDLVPETGSAGILNGLLCSLRTFSAELPCRMT